jgi:hypothetical protein
MSEVGALAKGSGMRKGPDPGVKEPRIVAFLAPVHEGIEPG